MAKDVYGLGGVYDDLFGSSPKKGELKNQDKIDKAMYEINQVAAGKPVATNADVKPSQRTEEVVEEAPTLDEVKQSIEKLIGLTNIKSDIDALMDFIKIQKIREKNGLPTNGLSLHTAFIGNPGTGKTTIARLMGEYFKAIGILEKGHLVEVSRADLVAEFVGGTATKTNEVIDSAIGGILFIDEAYSLSQGTKNDYGLEAINIIVDRMEKERDNLAIFFAGYNEDMEKFFQSNAGLASRVTRKFYFEDYDGGELFGIFNLISKKNGYLLDEQSEKDLQAYFNHIYYIRDKHFGNGRTVRNTFEKLIKQQADRLASEDWIESETPDVNQLMTISTEDMENTLNLSEILVDHDELDHILQELNQYVGLEEIKEYISDLINLIRTNKMRSTMGLPVKSMTYHSIFTGSPGTGKTTIARILGKIFQSLGVLKKGHLVEVDRASLVGGYVGQTEEKTAKVIDSAMDGVLFIDEAYALAGGGNDYGQKAIDTILKRMDDDRERLVVIVAGYTDEMATFVNSNPGLKDRFTRKFDFKDFTFTELTDIFKIISGKQKYQLNKFAEDRLLEYFENILITNPKDFGNGRYVRNLFESVIMEQANRLSGLTDVTREDLMTITCDDVDAGINNMK